MAGGDWMDMYRAAGAGDLELVRFHIQMGVDPNYVHPEYMSTVLVTAILGGHSDVALYLLDHGARPDVLSEMDGLTPAEAAAQVGLEDVRRRLLERG